MSNALWYNQPQDNKFISLYKEVIQGNIPYFHALISKEFIKPFSSFHPSVTKEYEDYVFRTLAAGEVPSIHVYQEGNKFVLSDDYLLYQYYLQIGVTEFPCFCMGEPTGEGVIKKKQVGTPSLPSFETI